MLISCLAQLLLKASRGKLGKRFFQSATSTAKLLTNRFHLFGFNKRSLSTPLKGLMKQTVRDKQQTCFIEPVSRIGTGRYRAHHLLGQQAL